MGRMFEFQDWKEDMLECWNIGILLDPTRFRFKRLPASINPSFQYSIYAVLSKKVWAAAITSICCSRISRRYHTVKPPSTFRFMPVTYAEARDARKSSGPCRSVSAAMRPRGTR